jgi:succinate dehydrogenase/fumarate reductase-like Fe-S protein
LLCIGITGEEREEKREKKIKKDKEKVYKCTHVNKSSSTCGMGVTSLGSESSAAMN